MRQRWKYSVIEYENGDQMETWVYPTTDIAKAVHEKFIDTISEFDEYRNGKVTVMRKGRKLIATADGSALPSWDLEFVAALSTANQTAMAMVYGVD